MLTHNWRTYILHLNQNSFHIQPKSKCFLFPTSYLTLFQHCHACWDGDGDLPLWCNYRVIKQLLMFRMLQNYLLICHLRLICKHFDPQKYLLSHHLEAEMTLNMTWYKEMTLPIKGKKGIPGRCK